MDKSKSIFAIYKYDFHKAKEPTIQAVSDSIDGEKNVKIAQACFASLFDLNSVDNLVKFNKKGEPTRLPNDVLAKAGDIFIWRVNNSQMKEWWIRSGKDSKGIDNYEKKELHFHTTIKSSCSRADRRSSTICFRLFAKPIAA